MLKNEWAGLESMLQAGICVPEAAVRLLDDPRPHVLSLCWKVHLFSNNSITGPVSSPVQ